MHPDQSGAPSSGNPYQFIMEPPKAPKKNMLPALGSGGNFLVKIGVLVGGAVLLMVIIAVVVNVFFAKPSNVEDLVGLAQTETEILRITSQNAKITDQTLRNATATTATTIDTQLQARKSALASKGREVEDQEFSLKANAATDAKLKAAEQSNTYDIAFKEVLHTYLTSYAGLIQTTYDHTTQTAEKQTLQKDFTNVKTLLALFETKSQ